MNQKCEKKKNISDAHAPASCLKLWYRELYDPLIPDELYDECVSTEDPKIALAIVERLPSINKMVCSFFSFFFYFFPYREYL